MKIIPDQAADRREMAVGVMQRLEDLNTVLGQTNDHRHRVLVAAAKNIKIWFVKVRKIKAIYHTLNLFNLDVTQKCLIAECWIPTADIEAIQLALRRGTERSGSTVAPILNQMQTKESPPTFFRYLHLAFKIRKNCLKRGFICLKYLSFSSVENNVIQKYSVLKQIIFGLHVFF